MKSLLSTAMLKILMARGDFASAARCCLQGADVSSEQATKICNSFAEETERRAWIKSMLLQASNASMAKLLLEQGADVAAALHDGKTALMLAAANGHAMRPWPSCCCSTVPMWRQQCTMAGQH